MVDENNSSFYIRKFDISDSERVVKIWKACGLVRDWNNTELVVQEKLFFKKNFFLLKSLKISLRPMSIENLIVDLLPLYLHLY